MNLIPQKYLKRDSNMELLRIIAMLGILVVHSDFFALGAPTKEDCISAPLVSAWRYVVENITIISVNLFVLLSGWYGIHPQKKRIIEFLFQILFFNLLFFVLFASFMLEETLTRQGVESIFMLDSRFWFVKAYLLLYLLSPILNSYIEKAPQRQFKLILLAFFAFQTIYGWLYPSVSWFKFGYSTISFIFIYLLASYLRKYKEGTEWRSIVLLATYLAFILLNSAVCYASTFYGRNIYIERLIAYNSPLVIVASTVVFLFFTRIRFKSGLVNFVAISSFAAFLFQGNYFFVEEVYRPWLRKWFSADTLTLFSIKAFVFILVIFCLSIMLDKIRIRMWEKVSVKL